MKHFQVQPAAFFDTLYETRAPSHLVSLPSYHRIDLDVLCTRVCACVCARVPFTLAEANAQGDQ